MEKSERAKLLVLKRCCYGIVISDVFICAQECAPSGVPLLKSHFGHLDLTLGLAVR